MSAYRTSAIPEPSAFDVARPFFPDVGDRVRIGPRLSIMETACHVGRHGTVTGIYGNVYAVKFCHLSKEQYARWGSWCMCHRDARSGLFFITELLEPTEKK